jgi:tetratricopeptide (TPR) repeat protein
MKLSNRNRFIKASKYIIIIVVIITVSSCHSNIVHYANLLVKGEINSSGIEITYPKSGTIFPPEFPAPKVEWKDFNNKSLKWYVIFTAQDGNEISYKSVNTTYWKPDSITWAKIKSLSVERKIFITVINDQNKLEKKVLNGSGIIDFSTSKDSVGAPIFYRAVPLPFSYAVKNVFKIEWYLGKVSGGRPKKVLDNMPVCANCHTFSQDGSLLAMDVDYGNDKGSYAISPTKDTCKLTPENIITWSDYKREENDPTFGLLSQISPDGKFVLSTVKDLSVFVAIDNNMAYSQLFFPIKGIIGIYNRENKTFGELPGANEKKYVQSNPNWSPDGKKVVYARTNAYISERVKKSGRALLSSQDIEEFFSGGKQFKFDLYSIDFNGGNGGKPEPLAGGSMNGKSNYFARFSPNGKWIVFCQSDNFMLLRPDSRLYIMPSCGGKPRLMNCNLDSMNSWHSWSPNSKWLVFSSKHRGIYTQLYLTHIDENGNDSPPVLLENLLFDNRAANIPEFFPGKYENFNKIKDAFSQTAASYAAIASDELTNKFYKRAWNSLQKAIQLDSNCIEAYFSRIILNSKLLQSNSKTDIRDKNKVLELAASSHIKNKKEEDILLLQATIHSNSGNTDLALKEAEKILSINAGNYRTYEFITSVLRKSNKYQQTLPYYEKMIKLVPANATQLKKIIAEAYVSLGKNDKALSILNKLISEHPYDNDLLASRAGIFLENKKFDNAKTDLNTIVSNEPENYKYYQLRAHYYLLSGNKNLALVDYTKALDILTEKYSKNNEDIELLFDKAEQQSMIGNLSGALADYNNILETFPINYEALKQKTKILLSNQQWTDVIASYETLIQNYREEEEFFNNEAIAYLNLGEYDKAMKKLDKTIELNSSNCDALFNRAKLKKMIGNKDEAKIDIQQIIKILVNKKNKGTITTQELELLNSVKSEL